MKLRTVFAASITRGPVLVAMWVSLVPAFGQRFDVTPLFGGRFGGTIEVEQPGLPNAKATLENSITYGVAAGFRFDSDDCQNCNLFEFRWMRQSTDLGLKQDPLVPTPLAAPSFRPAVTLDHFLGDFTHEWEIEEGGHIKPFLTGTLGAARMAAPASSGVRFVFGLSAGVKVFPKPNWGFRLQAEYLPTVMHAELQRLVCVQTCAVALNGGIMNQFQLTVGPIFRF